MTIDAIQEEIVEELNFMDNTNDKNDYVLDLGKELAPMNEDHKTEATFIHGCQSKAWIHSTLNEAGNMIFTAFSDSLYSKGMIALILRIFEKQTPENILKADLFFMDKVGLSTFVSQKRTGGMAAMIDKIKLDAAKALTYKG